MIQIQFKPMNIILKLERIKKEIDKTIKDLKLLKDYQNQKRCARCGRGYSKEEMLKELKQKVRYQLGLYETDGFIVEQRLNEIFAKQEQEVTNG